MMLFEQYGRSNEVEKIHSIMSDMWNKIDAMSVRILSGELEFNPRAAESGNHLTFELFDDMYQFSHNEWGDMEIYRSDNRGDAFNIGLDDKEYDMVIKNLKILFNFFKLRMEKKDTRMITRELSNFFEIYDSTKPDGFYREYLDYFKNNPEYLTLVEWPESEIKKMTDEERNIITSAKGGSKFKLFGESLNEKFDYGEFLEDLRYIEMYISDALEDLNINNNYMHFNKVASFESASNYKDEKMLNGGNNLSKGPPKYVPYKIRFEACVMWEHFTHLEEFTQHLHKIDNIIKEKLTIKDSKIMGHDYLEYLVELDDKAFNIINSMKGIDKFDL